MPKRSSTRDRIASEYKLEIVTLTPALTMEDQTARMGVLYLSSEGQERCCHMRKTEPLLAIKGQFDALIGSLRRSEGGQRSKCPILAVDPEMNCVRVNPLAAFSDKQMDEYVEAHNVIINPLHTQGYTTIGCNRCTTPVLPGEPLRAGRWRPWAPGRFTAASIRPTSPARKPSPSTFRRISSTASWAAGPIS